MNADEIIIEPVLSEKTNLLREGLVKQYTFKVDKRANKMQIKDAVRTLFKVNPSACNIINVKGKPKTSRTKSGYTHGRTRPWKKAIVTLKKGEAIEMFEGN